jgi:RecA-family ATPase
MAKRFDPIRWIVKDYLPEGFSVLAGRQKLGKTWLAIDISFAVACGGVAMGAIECEQGDVLYLDLENGERRIQRRIDALYPIDQRPDLSRLEGTTEAPPLDNGLIEAFDDWRRSMPNPRLVVIDVLQRIKPIGNPARNSYENDYSAWVPLQSWATEHSIAVLGLHHTKRAAPMIPLRPFPDPTDCRHAPIPRWCSTVTGTALHFMYEVVTWTRSKTRSTSRPASGP